MLHAASLQNLICGLALNFDWNFKNEIGTENGQGSQEARR